MEPKTRKYGKIDKSKLKFGEPERIKDVKYRKSYEDSFCMASRNGTDFCGRPACGAHINDEECAGIAQKASDDLTWPLCQQCHSDQHANPGASWWLENVFKPMARRRYREWKSNKGERR